MPSPDAQRLALSPLNTPPRGAMTTLLGHLSALVFLVVEGIKPPIQLGIQGGSQAKGRTALEARGEKQDALVRRKGWGLPEHKTLTGISSWELRPDGNVQWVGEGSMTIRCSWGAVAMSLQGSQRPLMITEGGEQKRKSPDKPMGRELGN